jgi:hypothetical protein
LNPNLGSELGLSLDRVSLGRVPTLDTGGVVSRGTYAQLAVNNVPEVVAPLNEQSLAPFAKVIANVMSQQGTPVERNNISDDYILIPVDKRHLYRELYVIGKQEALRRGV